jgi:alanyl aminopeptidase
LLLAVAVVACSAPPKRPPPPPVPVAVKPADPVAPPLPPEKPTLRLPKNFTATGYTATLAIDPNATGFTGTIAIAGNVSERSQAIWLHARELKVARATANGTVLTAKAHPGEFLELSGAAPFEAGPITLTIEYAGKYELLNTTGAFKQIVAGAPYVFTQFEALYARRVFPCIDEPDSKVPWKLALEVPSKLVAVSNTHVEHEELTGDRKRVEFAQTKPLPSYLIAFGVGPFELVDAGRTKSGTPVRIVALKDRAADAAWAAKTTPRILELLEEWFGSSYPYEKLDMLSIPITVGFGAMENAGLVTFAETLILLDPKHASKGRQYTWVLVAAHELAHQWFGDLVTTAYWDDIWLNEGFAQWAERKVTLKFDTAWHDDLGEVGVRNGALGDDSLVSARQIRQPIKSEDDILNAFDGITYNKGASVLNMFESYLGSDVFMRGVREYLKDHAWGNATSSDFAQAISKASGKDVTAAFATFLEQPGAPEITTTVTCEKGQPPRVELSQHRYVPPGAPTPPATKPWIVPVCVAYDKNGQRGQACTLLDQPTGSLALEGKGCPRWVMPNHDGRGYYRNAYTAAQVVALRDEAWSHLKWTERRALYFDTSNAASNGKLPLQLALSFIPKLLAGGDRFTVGAAIGMPVGLEDWVPDDLRQKYESWLRQTFSPGALKAGLVPKDSDDLDVESTRAELVGAAAGVAHEPALVAEAVKLADKWRDLPQAIREQVLYIAADASPEVFERILHDVHGETDRARREEMLDVLGSVRDPKRQAKALELVLDPKLDPRETLTILYSARLESNRSVAQQYFRDHTKEILARLPADETAGGVANLSSLFTSSCDPARRDAIADYVTKTFGKMPGGARVIQQNIEEMDHCIARRQLLVPEIRGWLTGVKIPKPPEPKPAKPEKPEKPAKKK